MVTLKYMRRYLQDAGACAFGAVATVGNHFNRNINYDIVCKIESPDGNGLYTPNIGLLLNKVGFEKVTVITADLDLVDFKWQNLSKHKLIEEIKQSKRKHPQAECRDILRQYFNFLNAKKENNLIIDHHFGNYIRSAIDSGLPVLASFNWNLLFKHPKFNDFGEIDPIKGEAESHEIVICGYDNKSVNIIDSHHEMYKGKLKKFRNGRYKIEWEIFMTVLGHGDLIIPDQYSKENSNA